LVHTSIFVTEFVVDDFLMPNGIRRNPFLQHRRHPLFETVERRIPAARISYNHGQVSPQVIRFGTNL